MLVKLIALLAWLTYCGPVNVLLPVVASWPSIRVTLPEIDPEVEANEEDTVEEVASRLVTLVDNDPEVVLKLVSSVVNLVLKEADCAANEADAFVKVVILASSAVNLVDNEADWAANELEADVRVLEVASKFPVLILKEPDVWAKEADVIAYDPEVTTYDAEVIR